jgi:hypothetical protein
MPSRWALLYATTVLPGVDHLAVFMAMIECAYAGGGVSAIAGNGSSNLPCPGFHIVERRSAQAFAGSLVV